MWWLRRAHRRQQPGESGQVLVLSALALVVLLGMAALVLDSGQVMVARRQLQNAVDAGAHAGVQVLPDDVVNARAAARTWTQENGASAAEITGVTVSTTNVRNDTITVTASRTAAYRLARVLPGQPEGATVRTTAAAIVGSVVGAAHVMPFGLEDLNGVTTPGFGYTFNQKVTLKEPPGNKNQLGPGNYGMLALDGRGGSSLRDTIGQGGSSTVYRIGDQVDTEPGQKTGPLQQGFAAWAARNGDSMTSSCNDWDASRGTTNGRLSVTAACKYRVVLIPIIDDWPNGRKAVNILGFAQVYITGFDDSKKQIDAVFLDDSFSHPDSVWGPLDSYGTRIVKLLR